VNTRIWREYGHQCYRWRCYSGARVAFQCIQTARTIVGMICQHQQDNCHDYQLFLSIRIPRDIVGVTSQWQLQCHIIAMLLGNFRQLVVYWTWWQILLFSKKCGQKARLDPFNAGPDLDTGYRARGQHGSIVLLLMNQIWGLRWKASHGRIWRVQ
jgi:hypothetical protein